MINRTKVRPKKELPSIDFSKNMLYNDFTKNFMR